MFRSVLPFQQFPNFNFQVVVVQEVCPNTMPFITFFIRKNIPEHINKITNPNHSTIKPFPSYFQVNDVTIPDGVEPHSRMEINS